MKQSPKSYIGWLLSRKEYSRAELLEKLLSKKVSLEEAQTTLDWASLHGIQSDERAARSVFRSGGQKRGDRWVKNKLKQKGLSSELIESDLQEYSELERLEQACLKFESKNLSDQKVYQSALRFLVARGFGFDASAKALKALKLSQDAQN